MKDGPLLWLPRNCANCRFFDGDVHCAIKGARLIPYIVEPESLVCIKHEPKDADDVEGAAV